ncbi:hypothetical protein H9L21_05680 [Aeromicrobium senzhongii]|uniref:Uncharacterized protein n=1 Tax=Aeromicrobium senzhongii TaxID=2663859 RepID=A0ABX6SVI8_9ACTN|nr:hypothetical protein [Aeromicrobium senzhongii]MTB87545.1 hypothetical protein [Aeromicrobium senzhongii]QNL95414.1 hypothetical protein H9L21_05680 [Aeromicrobium senzhongii]
MSSGVDELVGALRTAAQTVRSVTSSVAEELRALSAARDAAEAAMAERLAELDQSQGTWLRTRRVCRRGPGVSCVRMRGGRVS